MASGMNPTSLQQTVEGGADRKNPAVPQAAKGGRAEGPSENTAASTEVASLESVMQEGNRSKSAYYYWRKKHPMLNRVLVLFVTMIIYFGWGIWFYTQSQGFTVTDSIYFSMVTCSTVGYGDLNPNTEGPKAAEGQFITIFFIFFGIIAVFGQVRFRARAPRARVAARRRHPLTPRARARTVRRARARDQRSLLRDGARMARGEVPADGHRH